MSIYTLAKNIYYLLAEKKREKYIQGLINNGLNLGQNVQIVSDFFFDPSHCFLITIGDNTTIAPNVRLIAHDASTKLLTGYTKIGRIHIGNKCFIGDSTIVLPNVKIGDNSIIGAGSVVTRNIPSNSIAVGNPAQVIMTTEVYLKKINKISKNKTIFGEEYYINKLNSKKREEILASIGDSIGFIV